MESVILLENLKILKFKKCLLKRNKYFIMSNIRGKVKHELRVTKYEFKSTS